MKYNKLFFLALFGFFLQPPVASSMDRTGHLGIGGGQQLRNNLPALSVKIQTAPDRAYGVALGYKSGDEGGYGLALKIFKYLYDEPMLNFYVVGQFGVLSTKTIKETYSGYQLDAMIGSEFSFEKLESLGISFEAGMSLSKTGEKMSFQTVSDHIVVSSIHFYL